MPRPDPGAENPETRPAAAGTAPAGGRLDILDGMRGVAALLVVVYHFFARWSVPNHEQTLYPHGNYVQHLPFLSIFGMMGILLFFLISGFVIMMTLERSSGIVDFAGRRIARLWPAMLVCATLSTLIVNLSGMWAYYPGMGRWQVTPLEYLSSILFLPPDLTGRLAGLGHADPRWVEGVYWTLWHEVRFYALIALAYLLSPRAAFLWVWAGLQGVSTLIELIGAATGRYHPFGRGADLIFQPQMLAWFSLGLCGYMLWSGRRSPAVEVIAALAVTAILAEEVLRFEGAVPVFSAGAGRALLTYAVVALPFVMFLCRSPLLNVLRLPFFLAVGLASYPLYLFHELPGMTGMMLGARAGLPPLPTALFLMACLILVALALHRLVERPGKRLLTRLWQRAFAPLETRLALLRF